MNDPVDDLKSTLDRYTPLPDPARRKDILTRARENFDRAQGFRTEQRPTSIKSPIAVGFLNGVRQMLSALSLRGALTSGTAVLAVGVVLMLPITSQVATGPLSSVPVSDATSVQSRDLSGPVSDLGGPAATPGNVSSAPATPTPGYEASGLPRSLVDGGFFPRSLELGAPVVGPLRAVRSEAFGVAGEGSEAFANLYANPVRITAEDPVSTFSVDVDTVSWSIVRSSLMAGQLPPTTAVRVEEMVNYFPYEYATPEPGSDPFRATVSLSRTPWNPDTKLLRIGLQGEMSAIADRPALNLVFLVDTSGSMQDANKLPLLKQSFRLMLAELRPEDQVAIVAYAGSAGLVLEPTAALERHEILQALNRLEAGGATAGREGLELAYTIAENMTEQGELGRVILATDGDFNVGLSEPARLEDYIARKRQGGTYLSVLGFGRGNLNDATMQALAQAGNGKAAYIDTLAEARKVLVDQLTGEFFPIAGDVKVQVEFNPSVVAEYRLIGYETRTLRREDFNNDLADAGDIGAGHSITALYELAAPRSPAVLNDPLRYQDVSAETKDYDEVGYLRLRYKQPGHDKSNVMEIPIGIELTEPDADMRFAAAIAGFGQLLTGSTYLGDWSWPDAISLAEGALGDDPYGYRREALTLMRLAKGLSN